MKFQTRPLSDVTTRLAPTSDTAGLDASVLIAHIVGKPRSWVIAHPDLTLTIDQQNQLKDSLARLERGEPLPYVIGNWEFFGLSFEITPAVLIPRPETELLVEKAIAWLQQNSEKKYIADVGTGSGCIAVTLAVHVPSVRVLTTDISSTALDVAKRNAKKYGVSDRIEFVECDLLPHSFAPLPVGEGLEVRAFDLLCANLPYIPTETLKRLPVYGREPTVALDGGEDGLDLIRRLLNNAPEWLAPDGMILLEIESTRGAQASDLARAKFPDAIIHLHRDLVGNNRLLEIAL